MQSSEELRRALRRIDRRGYGAYKDLSGQAFEFPAFALRFDHIQGDPFAGPSRVSVTVKRGVARIPKIYRTRLGKVALEDFLARTFGSAIRRFAKLKRGSGKSGLVAIDAGGQEILERSCMNYLDGDVGARIFVGLPAFGRSIAAHEAEQMLFGELPKIVEASLIYKNIDSEALARHIRVAEDWEHMQAKLDELDIVAFVANGSVLPRRSGVDDRPPAPDAFVVPFKSPSSLEVAMDLPDGREVAGMGIPRGVTLIVGGGFHGKSTLLDALARCVYPHTPGDGREYVVANDAAVVIRSEDGRYIEKVDISPFISNLPLGRDTKRFSTDNASGSTSQAANIIEAIELGAKVLLIDEDTSASNFMIRDARMQRLVEKEAEPITPLVDRVRELAGAFGISTVLVMGGSGDYFDVADTVIKMVEYTPHEATAESKRVATEIPTARKREALEPMRAGEPRHPDPKSFDSSRGKREVKIGARGLHQINFGRTSIDLDFVEQIVDSSQTRAIGEAIYRYSKRYAKNGYSLAEGLKLLMGDIDERGLDVLNPNRPADLARPRIFEIGAAINRMRTLLVKE